LSAAARRYSERPEMKPERQFATFLEVLGEAARSKAAIAA
jgi:hypothetical protein